MQVSDVDMSLSYGQLLGKRQWVALLLFMITPVLLEILTIFILIVSLVVPDAKLETPIIVFIVFGNLLFLSLLAFSIYIKVKNNKLKRKVLLWLKDAIKTDAYSEKTGEFRFGMQPTAIKIKVSFKIYNTAYVRDSTVKIFGGKEGYIGGFKKYADRKICIAYSPKYDEVLILKDK